MPQAPVKLPVANKLVYSPHVYGPDVFGQPYFNDPNFPANMPDIWDRHFGYMKSKGLGPALCAGEWGGWAKEGGKDRCWQESLAKWMVDNDIMDSFYWCLNPNSGDTGGQREGEARELGGGSGYGENGRLRWGQSGRRRRETGCPN